MKNINKLPSEEELRRLFHYDVSTGLLRWIASKKGHKAGQIAGYINPKGYRIVMINKKNYHASRIIWKIMVGVDPGQSQVDHINLNKSDDRFGNLRLSDNSKNHANTGLRVDNKTGYKGVFYISFLKKFEARIKNKVIGYFKDPKVAAEAYNQKGFELYGEHFRPNII